MMRQYFMNMKKNDINFLFKWFGSLIAVWYFSTMLYIHDREILEMLYWPLHTHDIEIEVIESTVNWQSYIDKLDKDLEKGYLYVE